MPHWMVGSHPRQTLRQPNQGILRTFVLPKNVASKRKTCARVAGFTKDFVGSAQVLNRESPGLKGALAFGDVPGNRFDLSKVYLILNHL